MDKLELELEMELAQCLMQLSHYRCFSESPLFFFRLKKWLFIKECQRKWDRLSSAW